MKIQQGWWLRGLGWGFLGCGVGGRFIEWPDDGGQRESASGAGDTGAVADDLSGMRPHVTSWTYHPAVGSIQDSLGRCVAGRAAPPPCVARVGWRAGAVPVRRTAAARHLTGVRHRTPRGPRGPVRCTAARPPRVREAAAVPQRWQFSRGRPSERRTSG